MADKHIGRDSADQPEKHKQGSSDLHTHQVRPEVARQQLQREKQQTAADHQKMINDHTLPTVHLVDSKAHNAPTESKGFFSDLVEGAKQGIDGLTKQVDQMVTGAEKLGGQIVDASEQALDSGLKAAGVSNDVSKAVKDSVHTIRRIDEAEYKLAKGVVHGAQRLVGGIVHSTIATGAEVLDKAEERRKIVKEPNAAIVVAAAEVIGGKIVGTLGAAEKFGEKLRKQSDKEGGLDKLVSHKAQQLAQEAGKWISETNIENIGAKAEQIGEKLPDAALLAAGGMGMAKATAETAEAINAMRTGSKISETTEAIATTSEAATESTALQEATAVETISHAGDKYTLLSNGDAVAETAAGQTKPYTYMTRNDGETIILTPKNATPNEALEHSIVIDKDSGIVSEGLIRPGKGMGRDPEAFNQALNELPPGSKFVGKGQDRIAFETPSGDVYVLGPIQTRPACPVLAQPLEIKTHPPLIQVEKFPKLDVSKIEQHHIDLVKQRAKESGWQILDDHPANFGMDKHGNVFTLDPEGVVPIE